MLNLTKNPIVKFCKTINIFVPADTQAGTKLFFPFDEEISNCKLTGLIFNPNANFGNGNISGSINNNLFAGTNGARVTYITLVNNKNENIVNQLPVSALWTMNSSGNITIRRFNNYIDLGKSYIVPTETISNLYYSFTFYYTNKN
jgi:hypothetical protein